MIPSIVASELQEAIRRFLYASFPMTTPGFRREDGGTMRDDLLAEPEAIFKGPYLGLAACRTWAAPTAPVGERCIFP